MLAIDIGSFPVSKRGNNCFLMMLDSNTKFMAVSAMKGQKADVVKSAVWDKWYPYFGIPEELCSDQGKNVDGEVIRKLCEDLNKKKMRSSPFHPQSNGSAEKAIGTLKTIMRSMIQSRQENKYFKKTSILFFTHIIRVLHSPPLGGGGIAPPPPPLEKFMPPLGIEILGKVCL